MGWPVPLQENWEGLLKPESVPVATAENDNCDTAGSANLNILIGESVSGFFAASSWSQPRQPGQA